MHHKLWQMTAFSVAALFLAPLLWLLIASLQPVGLPPPRTLTGFAHGVAWSNYGEIFRIAPLAQQLGNSLFVSTVGAGVTVLTASWAGFAMAQMPSPVRRWLVGLALLLLLVPSSAVWLPRYVLFAALGLIDTYVALVAPALMGTKALLVLMYYWSFRRVSPELFESAWLDGAGAWTSWRCIALPLAAPTTLAVAVLAFSHYWSDFVDPLLFLKSAPRFTIAVGLRMLQQLDVTNWPLLLAAVVVMSAPVILLYLALQVLLREDADFVRRTLRFSAMLIVLMLAACAPAAQSPSGTASRTTITFLISGDPADEDAYRTLVAAFMAANPDAQVELLNIPGQSDFRRRLAADFAAGAPPDIFLINYRRYGAFVAAGAIEPAGPYLAQSAQIRAADFYPQALAAFTWQNELMCMPQNMSSPMIYYNKDSFDAAAVAYPAPDWTWDDFLTTAQALTTDSDGVIDQYGVGIEPALVRVAPFIWMNGGEIVDDPTAPARLTLDSPESRAALVWFVALQTVHHVVPDAVAEAAESSMSRFLNGRLAMYVESRRVAPEFRRIERFDWDVAPLPTGKMRASILHADAYCMAAASQHKAAAWRFVEFANTRAGQTLLARTGRTVPSRRELTADPAFLDPQVRPANSRVFVDIIPALRNFPTLATWSDVEAVVDAELKQAFYGQITLDEAIGNATARSAEFLR